MPPETGLRLMRAQHLRCLHDVDLETHPAANIIIGANGAGKTSLLEAIYLLGRGKSFRAGKSSMLIQTGQQQLTVYGEVDGPEDTHRLGLSINEDGLEVHCDGEKSATIADLAAALPVQIIDPEVHALIQSGPSERRSFIDWGVFHVKHEFLPAWRRFRRALKQRNAALKQGAAKTTVTAWDAELIESGLQVDTARSEFIDAYLPLFAEISLEMIQMDAKCVYQHGWRTDTDFAAALHESWDRDAQYGTTQVGPHRAELRIDADGQPARHRLSRGQQKLLSIAMVLAQSLFVARALGTRVTLLVDEPAAELDHKHLKRLVDRLLCDELQLFISTLDRDALPEIAGAHAFHVELGEVRALV